MERVLVLSARNMDFKASDGNQVQMVTLTYLTGEVLAEGDRRGIEPLTVQADRQLFAEVVGLPAVCEMEFRQRPGAKGRPTLFATAVRIVKAVDFGKLFEPHAHS